MAAAAKAPLAGDPVAARHHLGPALELKPPGQHAARIVAPDLLRNLRCRHRPLPSSNQPPARRTRPWRHPPRPGPPSPSRTSRARRHSRSTAAAAACGRDRGMQRVHHRRRQLTQRLDLRSLSPQQRRHLVRLRDRVGRQVEEPRWLHLDPAQHSCWRFPWTSCHLNRVVKLPGSAERMSMVPLQPTCASQTGLIRSDALMWIKFVRDPPPGPDFLPPTARRETARPRQPVPGGCRVPAPSDPRRGQSSSWRCASSPPDRMRSPPGRSCRSGLARSPPGYG